MANLLFDAPPALAGDEKEQMLQVYRYLQQMSEQLNEAMNNLNYSSFTPEAETQIRTIAAAGTKTETDRTKTALRSLIIKTADIVRHEMQEISTTLTESMEAYSEHFGELTESMDQRITANANGVEQYFQWSQVIDGKAEGYDGFITRMNERIFSGRIGTDLQGNPVFGIAIGEGVTQYDTDGNPVFNPNARMATFTKTRLSFWMGDTEVAYFGDRKLYITNAEVLHEMKMGFYIWEVQSDNSLGLMVAVPSQT